MDIRTDIGVLGVFLLGAVRPDESRLCLSGNAYAHHHDHPADHAGCGLGTAAGQSGVSGYDSTGNKVADATTGTDGKAVFSDLALGSYTYQEISAPSGYVVDDTKYPITITSTTLNITATRTNALGKASVEISKVDADSNTPLQGAGFRLYDASGSQVAEGYTDANGMVPSARTSKIPREQRSSP